MYIANLDCIHRQSHGWLITAKGRQIFITSFHFLTYSCHEPCPKASPYLRIVEGEVGPQIPARDHVKPQLPHEDDDIWHAHCHSCKSRSRPTYGRNETPNVAMSVTKSVSTFIWFQLLTWLGPIRSHAMICGAALLPPLLSTLITKHFPWSRYISQYTKRYCDESISYWSFLTIFGSSGLLWVVCYLPYAIEEVVCIIQTQHLKGVLCQKQDYNIAGWLKLLLPVTVWKWMLILRKHSLVSLIQYKVTGKFCHDIQRKWL